MENKVKIENFIKRMLKKGDLKPNEISSYFGIPMEKIKECQQQIEKEANVEAIVQNLFNKGYTSEEILLYVEKSIEKINNKKTTLEKTTSDQEMKGKPILDENRDGIKQHSKKRNNNSNSNKKETTLNTTKNTFNEYIDPNELLEHFKEIGNKLKNQNVSSRNKRMELRNEQTNFANKYADAIIKIAGNSNNLEELENLSKNITFKMAMDFPLSIGRARTFLGNKITKLKQTKYLNNYNKIIPKRIIEIALNISDEAFDYQNAIEIIEQEANNRVQEKTKTKFSLTEEQEATQILNQLKSIILENQAEQYAIKNPQVAIENLLKITNNDFNYSLSAVIHNLINRKEFDIANEICDKYLKEYNYSEKHHNLYLICKSLKTQIINAEEKQEGKVLNSQDFSK